MKRPATMCMVHITPVKDQGNSSLCWIYAMLATIESEHLMMGDSVNLSAHFVARKWLEEEAERVYLSGGREEVNMRGMASDLLQLIQRQGLTHFDSFRAETNYNGVERKVQLLARRHATRHTGLTAMQDDLRQLLDDEIHPELLHVFLLGQEYTPLEFAHSVCRDDEYMALTSFTHHPFGERCVLEMPDNRSRNEFLNLPLDTLMAHIEGALRNGHPVCWEGDISEPGFSADDGFAMTGDESQRVTQQIRQQMFDRLATTNDHCMEMVGMARDNKGHRYFVCKNSWGETGPFGGLIYLSENYVRAKTVAVWLSQKAFARNR